MAEAAATRRADAHKAHLHKEERESVCVCVCRERESEPQEARMNKQSNSKEATKKKLTDRRHARGSESKGAASDDSIYVKYKEKRS